MTAKQSGASEQLRAPGPPPYPRMNFADDPYFILDLFLFLPYPEFRQRRTPHASFESDRLRQVVGGKCWGNET